MATATGVFHTTYRKDLALRHTRAEYVRLGLLVARSLVRAMEGELEVDSEVGVGTTARLTLKRPPAVAAAG